MHAALDIVDAALPKADPAEAYSVTHKAWGSAIKVIARADDFSGIIGDACRRLLELHPKVAAAANVPAAKLIDWMMTFQFDGDVDYFTLDPVAYAPALGQAGMAAYRARLMQIEAGLGQRPSQADRWTSGHSHEWFTLEWNARRLAVLDRDIEAIIRTHARDRRVAAWLQDTAEAFEEIGQTDLAIDWAKQATDFNDGHQSRRAADYWCELLDKHRPHESLHARLLIFRRWPSATTATRLHAAADTSWPGYRAEVMTTLASHPRDAVMFALRTLKDVEFAWVSRIHSLSPTTRHGANWSRPTRRSTPWPSFPFCSALWRTNWWRPRPRTTVSPRDGWRRCADWRPAATTHKRSIRWSPNYARTTPPTTTPTGIRPRRTALNTDRKGCIS